MQKGFFSTSIMVALYVLIEFLLICSLFWVSFNVTSLMFFRLVDEAGKKNLTTVYELLNKWLPIFIY